MNDQKFSQDKMLAVRDADMGIIAVVDSPEAAADFLMEGWVGPRTLIWSYKDFNSIEIQNVFGATGRTGISEEQLYNFCVDMLKGVYSKEYNWDFELCQLEYRTSK
jgi:hypothetical protein